MFTTKTGTHQTPPALARNRGLIEYQLLAVLPHGSGINCKWCFEWFDNGNVKASNSYHCMNENGFYVGFADFSATFKTDKPFTEFRLQFHGSAAQNFNRRFQLRDFLDDTIVHAFHDMPHVTPNNMLYWFNEFMTYGTATNATPAAMHTIAAYHSEEC